MEKEEICKITSILFLIFIILYSSTSLTQTLPPDLSVESIILTPSNPIVYENVTIKVVVKNKGNSKSPSVNGSLSIDNMTQFIKIPALGIGSSTTLTMYWTPQNYGNYTIIFVANCNQEINELTWSNNVITTNIYVREGKADLRADEIIFYPSIPTIGQNVSLKAKITNVGTKNSSSCVGTFYANEEVLTTVYIWPLTPGSCVFLEPVIWVPKETGTYKIRFWADSNNLIEEPNEENNNVSVVFNIYSNDTKPPTVEIDYLPRYVTERDNVTFFVNASDESGIDYISISIHTEPSLIYLGNISYDVESLIYTCASFPRKNKVYYYAEAKDKAGNLYITSTYNFTVESYFQENLTVDLHCSPENPTEFDEIYLTATAYYSYGIAELGILNYKTNYTMIKRYNTTEVTFGPLGPFTVGTELAYWAKAVDVDGNIRYSEILRIKIGEVKRRNMKNISTYENGMVFLISDTDWRAVLSMVPISIWNEENETIINSTLFEKHKKLDPPYSCQIRFPTLIYHYENDSSIDVNPIINFLNYRWNASKIVIIGDPPDYLLEKLLAPKPVGAGLNENQIDICRASYSPSILNIRCFSSLSGLKDAIQGRWDIELNIDAQNITFSNISLKGFSDQALYQLRQRYWNEINKVVITEDEYGVALEAAVYASLINAPLLFQGHYNIEEIKGKRVFLIGDFYEEEIELIESYAHVENHYKLSELQDALIRSGARNIVLVNPLDHWVGFDEYDTTLGFSKFYYKQSLLAPFLAVTKRGVIVEATSLSYTEVDRILQEFIDNSPMYSANPHIIILASPSVIPIARPNIPSCPELYGDNVYFEIFNYNDIDIKRVNIGTLTNHTFSFANHQFEPFVSNEIEGAKEFGGVIRYKIKAGKEVKEDMHLIDAKCLRTKGNYMVYYRKGSDQTGNDIFICPYDYESFIYPPEKSAVNTTADEINPDITVQPDGIGWITWQQREDTNDDWDIHYMLFQKESGGLHFGANIQIHREGNQENPCINNKKVVYQDYRNGNWDIYMYDINKSNETRITFDENAQILPKISGDKVVWQDNRNGNWDIYMYDVSTGLTTGIATSLNPEVRPNINYRWIIWYERTNDGLWHLIAYEISTGLKKEVDVTEVSHEDSLPFLQVDNKFYSSKNNDGHIDYPTGRIFGLSTSDLSAYIATDIFFDEIEKNRYALIIARGLSESESRENLLNYTRTFWTDEVRNEFDRYSIHLTYHELEALHGTIFSKFLESYLTIFYDHGNTDVLAGFVSSFDLEKNYSKIPSFLLNAGCLTSGYYSTSSKQWLFVTHALRFGIINCLGFVDIGIATYAVPSGEIICDAHGLNPSILRNSFLDNKTFGESYMIGKNCCSCGSDVVILMGDPTIKPRWWD